MCIMDPIIGWVTDIAGTVGRGERRLMFQYRFMLRGGTVA